MEEADTTAQERIWMEGRREGIVQAKSETLERQVTETFGPLPRELEAHIDEQPEEVLDEYLDCLLSDVMCVSVKKSFALEERMQERFDELDLGDRRYLLVDCVDTRLLIVALEARLAKVEEHLRHSVVVALLLAYSDRK